MSASSNAQAPVRLLQGSGKSGRHDTTKENNKLSITDLKKMDSHEFLEKVKIIILKMFREVPENTEEQYNKIRRTIQEQNEKFNK